MMFVDGDDFIHSCACEILLRNLINTQADIAIGGFRKVDNITDVGKLFLIKYRWYIQDGKAALMYIMNLELILRWRGGNYTRQAVLKR
ncbi:MAG: hypothetical protein ACLTBV_09200 [Enterocloster bolteae]